MYIRFDFWMELYRFFFFLRMKLYRFNSECPSTKIIITIIIMTVDQAIRTAFSQIPVTTYMIL